MRKSWFNQGKSRCYRGQVMIWSWWTHGLIMVKTWFCQNRNHDLFWIKSWSYHDNTMVLPWPNHDFIIISRDFVMIKSWFHYEELGFVKVKSWFYHSGMVGFFTIIQETQTINIHAYFFGGSKWNLSVWFRLFSYLFFRARLTVRTTGPQLRGSSKTHW